MLLFFFVSTYSIKANSLKSLPEELCDLEYLQELCIADNQVTSLPEVRSACFLALHMPV
jgi:Leucine-rich repeat (LRR) protein